MVVHKFFRPLSERLFIDLTLNLIVEFFNDLQVADLLLAGFPQPLHLKQESLFELLQFHHRRTELGVGRLVETQVFVLTYKLAERNNLVVLMVGSHTLRTANAISSSTFGLYTDLH